ncbi:MAG: xanthine dehydrogenase family protein subunit M [Pirellulales bacterium]
MKNFDYAAPTSLAEASSLLARAPGVARVLAGGTDLIVQLRERLRDADLVVDVKRIPELTDVVYTPAAGLRLGAATPCYQVYENPQISAAYAALADAARIVGGWQIQSRASIGGNLCNSSPAGDTLAPLVALQARAVIAGLDGTRETPVAEFCTAPGRNVLAKGELLAALVFPAPVAGGGSAYQRFIPRNEMDIAVAGVASWVQLNAAGDTIVAARVALSAVAPTVRLADDASAWLAGKPAVEATYAEAGERAKAVASPISDMRGTAEFRTHLVGVLAKRTLAQAVERARSRQAN